MYKRILLSVFLILVVGYTALAHDTWIEKKDGQILVLRGHNGETEAYDPSLVKEARALDAKGQAVETAITKNKENATLAAKSEPVVVAALYDSGYWLKTTEGWKKTTKREAKGKYNIVEALMSKQYCKNVLAPCAESTKPLGQRFEVVPQKDPTAVKVGEKLPIKVVLDGKPVEGAIILTGGGHGSESKEPLKTDKDGMAQAPIAKAGMQMVKAEHKVPLKDDPDADVLHLASTVTFTAQ